MLPPRHAERIGTSSWSRRECHPMPLFRERCGVATHDALELVCRGRLPETSVAFQVDKESTGRIITPFRRSSRMRIDLSQLGPDGRTVEETYGSGDLEGGGRSRDGGLWEPLRIDLRVEIRSEG